jgi:hypothetical protein
MADSSVVFFSEVLMVVADYGGHTLCSRSFTKQCVLLRTLWWRVGHAVDGVLKLCARQDTARDYFNARLFQSVLRH